MKNFLFTKNFFILILVINFSFLIYNSFLGKGIASSNDIGEKIFKSNCAGCHQGGKNLIRKNKPIISSKEIASLGSLKIFLSSPHPPMPKFENIANDPEKLNSLHIYVNSLMSN